MEELESEAFMKPGSAWINSIHAKPANWLSSDTQKIILCEWYRYFQCAALCSCKEQPEILITCARCLCYACNPVINLSLHLPQLVLPSQPKGNFAKLCCQRSSSKAYVSHRIKTSEIIFSKKIFNFFLVRKEFQLVKISFSYLFML